MENSTLKSTSGHFPSVTNKINYLTLQQVLPEENKI